MDKKILIVDDEVNNLNSMNIALKMAGYKTITSENGRDALVKVFRNKNTLKPLDLLVVDLQLPSLTGFDLMNELNRYEMNIPFLVVSGHGDSTEMITDLIRQRCSDYVGKPFEPEELVRRVEIVFERERYFKGLESSGECATEYKTTVDDDWQVIKPLGDLKRDASEKFQTLLVSFLEAGFFKYRLDLAEVHKFDSFCLNTFICFYRVMNRYRREAKVEAVNVSSELSEIFRQNELVHFSG